MLTGRLHDLFSFLANVMNFSKAFVGGLLLFKDGLNISS